MKIKPDPIKSLHKRRKKEVDLIFHRFPKKIFDKGLEIGAGDGFQSTLLADYIKKLVCTEYVQGRLPDKDTNNIKYRVCDAEHIATHFNKNAFDIIFSSNLLEHLDKPDNFLQQTSHILKDRGIAIHSMPNRFWKLSQILLHHFNYLILFLERLSFKEIKNVKQTSYDNPKQDIKYSLLRRVVWSIPHGASKSNIEEFIKFGKKHWIRKFEANGFTVVKIIKGPVSSGYSLGFESIKKLLEKMHFYSVYIYITTKKGQTSNNLKYL